MLAAVLKEFRHLLQDADESCDCPQPAQELGGLRDCKAGEFRHGDDFRLGDETPHTNEAPPLQYYPDSIWAHTLFTNEFPNGVVYNVGSSRWSTDWNYNPPLVARPRYEARYAR